MTSHLQRDIVWGGFGWEIQGASGLMEKY